MLLATLLIMGVGTAAIGLLPSYDAIGIWAPVLLVTLRILQGIGVGGEYGGAVLLAVEYAPARRRGFYGASPTSACPADCFSLAVPSPWPACFPTRRSSRGAGVRASSSVCCYWPGAYIRLSVMETPAFERVQERKEVSRLPLRDLPLRSPSACFSAWAPRYIEGFTFNFFSVYLLAYVVTNLGLPKTLALNGILVGAALGVVLVLLTGAPVRPADASRSTGSGPGSPCSSPFPSPPWCTRATTWPSSSSSWPGSACCTGRCAGPLAAFWSELFETRYRFTALSTLYQVSGVAASGLTPLIAAWL